MRHDGGISGAMGHIDGSERLGERTNLVYFHENGIGHATLDAIRKTLNICDEKIVANQLAIFADEISDKFPPFPIIFGQSVFDRDNRIGTREFCKIFGLFLDRADFAFAFIMIGALFEKFSRCAIHGEEDVFSGLIASGLDCLHAEIKCSFSGWQIWCEPAFIADIGIVTCLLQRAFQRVEDLRTHPQGFRKARCPDRHDHEFLKIDRVIGVDPAIDDVHHWNRQSARRSAADVAIKR